MQNVGYSNCKTQLYKLVRITCMIVNSQKLKNIKQNGLINYINQNQIVQQSTDVEQMIMNNCQ
jgi:hypothetical protein